MCLNFFEQTIMICHDFCRETQFYTIPSSHSDFFDIYFVFNLYDSECVIYQENLLEDTKGLGPVPFSAF